LTPRLVRFTDTAQDHVRREKAWWLENRTHTEIFATELEHALKVLAVLPGAGTPYPQAGVVGLRRLYLRKVACHMYYTFDEREVIVRALWGAKRDKAPLLDP
jgi:plasmid stabilization system protein ParE